MLICYKLHIAFSKLLQTASSTNFSTSRCGPHHFLQIQPVGTVELTQDEYTDVQYRAYSTPVVIDLTDSDVEPNPESPRFCPPHDTGLECHDWLGSLYHLSLHCFHRSSLLLSLCWFSPWLTRCFHSALSVPAVYLSVPAVVLILTPDSMILERLTPLRRPRSYSWLVQSPASLLTTPALLFTHCTTHCPAAQCTE